MNEKIKSLLELIKENPELPIIPMVGAEVVMGYEYGRWLGSWGTSRIGEYYIGEERVHFRSDSDYDFEEIEDALMDGTFSYDEYEHLTDNETKAAYASLPWVKAIIVNIDTPD